MTFDILFCWPAVKKKESSFLKTIVETSFESLAISQ
jgi:hypothetical protein